MGGGLFNNAGCTLGTHFSCTCKPWPVSDIVDCILCVCRALSARGNAASILHGLYSGLVGLEMVSHTPCWYNAAVPASHLMCGLAFKFKAYVYDSGKSFWETGVLLKTVFPKTKHGFAKALKQITSHLPLLCQVLNLSWEEGFQPSHKMCMANKQEPNIYTRSQTTMSSEVFLLCMCYNAQHSGKAALRQRYMSVMAGLFQQLVEEETCSQVPQHSKHNQCVYTPCCGRLCSDLPLGVAPVFDIMHRMFACTAFNNRDLDPWLLYLDICVCVCIALIICYVCGWQG